MNDNSISIYLPIISPETVGPLLPTPKYVLVQMGGSHVAVMEGKDVLVSGN